MQAVDLRVGSGSWQIILGDSTTLIQPHSLAPMPAPAASLEETLVRALEHPIGFEPLRKALAPADRIVIVVDPEINEAVALWRALIAYLFSQNIELNSITTLLEKEDARFQSPSQNFPIEVHDPADRDKLSYLATTAKGRRIYLNKTLVDCDQAIVLSRRGYDPLFGQTGPESYLFPKLADKETHRSLAEQFRADLPGGDGWPLLDEVREVGWLLGIPYLIHVMENEDGQIADIQTGLVDTSAEVARLFDSRTRLKVAKPVDVAVVSFDERSANFRNLALSALALSRVLTPKGCICLLAGEELIENESMQRIQSFSSPREVLKHLKSDQELDTMAIFAWATAARECRLFLASGLSAEATEAMFAIKIGSAKELEKLVGAGGNALIVKNGHRNLFEVE